MAVMSGEVVALSGHITSGRAYLHHIHTLFPILCLGGFHIPIAYSGCSTVLVHLVAVSYITYYP